MSKARNLSKASIDSNGVVSVATTAVTSTNLNAGNIKHYNETVNARGSISGSQTIDLTLGGVVTCTITGTTTFTVTNVPTTGYMEGFVLYLTNGGSQTINWMTGIKWAGTPPTFTVAGLDILVFETIDAGTTWDGQLVGKAFA